MVGWMRAVVAVLLLVAAAHAALWGFFQEKKQAPDFRGILNRHPFPDVVHGCLLEGMALALERRYQPFSQGRGHITPQRVEEIETIAERHGIYLAPLYNADGPVESELRCQTLAP